MNYPQRAVSPSSWVTGLYWSEMATFMEWARQQGYRGQTTASLGRAHHWTLTDPDGHVYSYALRGQDIRCGGAPHLEQPIVERFLKTIAGYRTPGPPPAPMETSVKTKPPTKNGRCTECREHALMCDCQGVV